MELLYRLTADVIVVLHMLYVAFVLVGFLLVLLGIVCRWRWVRNLWFRLAHLACILIVVGEALLGITCPLTIWEQDLRRLGGQATYQGDFIANAIHELLFFDLPPQAFTAIYAAFGAAVLLTLLLAPPERRKSISPPAQ